MTTQRRSDMDYLPFIDDDPVQGTYSNEIEALIEQELRPGADLHPQTASVRMTQLRDNPLDSIYREKPLEDSALLSEYRKRLPRVDLARYAVSDSTDSDTLCVIDSYLRHQELTLQVLLPQTLVNQWAINNDYMGASDEVLQEVIAKQEKEIHTLNLYRAKMQTDNGPAFHRYEQEWKRGLISRLDSLG